MMKYSNKMILAASIAAASSQVMANGLSLNEQSASSAGSAYAGRASTASDASILFGNPAGMSRLKRAEVSGGLAFIDASTDISNTQGQLAPGLPVSGTNEGDMVPFSTVPFGYYVTPINDKLHAGIGLYVPYGVESDYEDTFQGRYHGLNSLVQVVTIQPTISYAFNDKVSVGFGPTINHIEGKLTSALPGAAFASINPALALEPDADVEIEGDDIAYGYNLGVMVAVTDRLDWGLAYHSKVDYNLEGDTTITGTPAPVAPALDGKYDAEVDITMPESVDTSISFKATDEVTLYAGATWTRWSRLEELVVENSAVHPMFASSFGEVSEELNWENTWAFAIGGAYQLNPDWVLRAGYARDNSPTRDADRTVRIPVSDRDILTLGAGWNVSEDLTLDAAYAYINEEKGGINQDYYSGDFENTAHGLALQATYRF
ncbi:outer membrane protein transport protein [Alcanivorax sp. S6407]|uniref:OmpP1/FadL family transporter n=1 Tax=Alcanivorax sp. S6407 TaxID=2926424 RepID=UPI001FF1CACC|nr:outer membrane protein transport protein [Alcanivorax sp. S6407]MCK0154705.1 outer membrane protein transport protein [Alcanivorax sp. S6407]